MPSSLMSAAVMPSSSVSASGPAASQDHRLPVWKSLRAIVYTHEDKVGASQEWHCNLTQKLEEIQQYSSKFVAIWLKIAPEPAATHTDGGNIPNNLY
jgi:hypothetical protein